MFSKDLGESLYRTWSEEQRREEIEKLVEGYRNGVPIGILCRMTLAIAGGQQEAQRHLAELMTLEERNGAVAKEKGAIQTLAREFLLQHEGDDLRIKARKD